MITLKNILISGAIGISLIAPLSVKADLQCPNNWVKKIINSVEVCVAVEQNQNQNQNQNQAQNQNNNQAQNNNQNVTATGGSSSSSSSSSSSVNLTVNNPSTPQVVSRVQTTVKELPKTGLPLAALALGGLLPAGLGLKKWSSKSNSQSLANSIWLEKELKS